MLVILLLSIAVGAQATSLFTVNTTLDLVDDNTSDGLCHTSANSCSLRAAIMQANHLPEATVVYIELPAGLYVLTRAPDNANGLDAEDLGDLNLPTIADSNQTLVIHGAGAASTIIDGNHADRILSIEFGRTLSIQAVTIRNGFRSSLEMFDADGGGIKSTGTLIIEDSIIYGNDGFTGGGVFAVGSSTFRRCTVSNNIASYGAGIASIIDTLTVQRSTIANNHASGGGGGIYATSAASIVGSTIESNTAGAKIYGGGGILSTGPTVVRDSTINANGAGNGGGIFSSDSLSVVNSTISANYADTDGGGIKVDVGNGSSVASIYNVTIVDNDADHDRDENGGSGGGIHVRAGARMIVVNSLIARNTQLDAPIDDDCQGFVESYGFNRFGVVSGCTIAGNGAPSWGPISPASFGPLRDNGGPTLTHALLTGSTAIDSTIDAVGCIDQNGTRLTTDQRGAPRVAGARCDVGAVEYASVFDSIFANGFD